ncbi:MAG: four helix bundle protein [Candidatus Marinimicrobia bacterium]|nr:four helix bundle protein [Candidatus Neomarinimicrobiota bacterium]
MNKEELIKRTAFFAHRCVKLGISLPKSILGKHIQGQLIRCSTSVAANYRAAVLAQSDAAFTAKISIVLEEADESVFWMEFINEEKLIKYDRVEQLLIEANELKAIFYSIRKTMKMKKS